MIFWEDELKMFYLTMVDAGGGWSQTPVASRCQENKHLSASSLLQIEIRTPARDPLWSGSTECHRVNFLWLQHWWSWECLWFGRSVSVTFSDLGHVLFWGDCHAGTHPTWGRARPGRAPGAPCSSPFWGGTRLGGEGPRPAILLRGTRPYSPAGARAASCPCRAPPRVACWF